MEAPSRAQQSQRVIPGNEVLVFGVGAIAARAAPRAATGPAAGARRGAARRRAASRSQRLERRMRVAATPRSDRRPRHARCAGTVVDILNGDSLAPAGAGGGGAGVRAWPGRTRGIAAVAGAGGLTICRAQDRKTLLVRTKRSSQRRRASPWRGDGFGSGVDAPSLTREEARVDDEGARQRRVRRPRRDARHGLRRRPHPRVAAHRRRGSDCAAPWRRRDPQSHALRYDGQWRVARRRGSTRCRAASASRTPAGQ